MKSLGSSSSSATASIAAFAQQARAGRRLSVVFLGGSLTWGAQATDPQRTSYRARLADALETEYPEAHFRFWDAAIGGTGSQLAAFRLERDVLSRRPDLVFLDFTVNDGPFDPPRPNRLAAYESLVRRIVERGVPLVQAIFPVRADVEAQPAPRPLDDRHREIAAAYGVPSADAVAWVRRKVREEKCDPGVLWPVEGDATHPGDDGYALYAEAVGNAFRDAVRAGTVCRVPDRPLHADTYLAINRQKLSALPSLPPGWKVGAPHRTAIAFDFCMSRWLDDVSIAAAPQDGSVPGPLRLRVRGRDLLLFGEGTPLSGRYEVAVDGGAPRSFDARCATGNMRHVEMIAEDLAPEGEHLVVLTPRLEPGQELRFESLCVAGAPATVRPA